MSEREVSMVFHRPIERKFINPNRWKFEPVGRLSFLQRWAWKLLLKLGAVSNVEDSETEYRRINFKASKVFAKIMESREAKLYTGDRPTRILLGPDVMDDIISDPDFHSMSIHQRPISFDAKVGYDQQIYGMKMTIVPWMRGFVILDDRCLR